MELTKNIQAIGLGIFLSKYETLIISDLHIGFESSLENQGVLVPKFQLKDIIAQLNKILKTINSKQTTVVINGDLKHEFGRINKQEWNDSEKLFKFLADKFKKIIVIKGNHDVILAPLLKKINIESVKELVLGNILICHGNYIPELDKSIKTIIIGHEHPAISIRTKMRSEKFKCYIKGKYKARTLIVQPSFNPLIEGSDVLKEQLLSPFIKNISLFEAFVYDAKKKDVLNFGIIKNL